MTHLLLPLPKKKHGSKGFAASHWLVQKYLMAALIKK